MRTSNKRIMAAMAAVAALSMALAGCGSSGGSDANKSGDTKSGGKVELTYLHRLPDKQGMTMVKDTVARWNKDHPNIQVKATKFNGSPGDLIKKLETDVKAGNAPDLAQVGYAELPEVYTKGIVEDVTAEAGKYSKDFAEGPSKLMSVDGKVFGLPQDTGPMVYYYNKTEFDKLGIKVPTTAEEFIESAKKAAAQGKYIMTYQPDGAGMAFSALSGASSPWYKIKDGKWVVNVDTPGSKATADFYQQLLDAKAMNLTPSTDPSFAGAFHDGSIIGSIDAAWNAPIMMDWIGDAGKGQWRVTQIGDWFKNGQKTGPNGGSGVAAIKGTKHKAEAMEFLDWFNTQVPDLTSQGLIVAASTEKAKTPQSWTEFFGGQDVMAEFAKANANMGSFNYMPGFSAVSSAVGEAADKAGKGQAKVSDAFDAAQKTSLATLKDYGLPIAKD